MPKSRNNRKGKERKNRKRNLERFKKELALSRNEGNLFAQNIARMQSGILANAAKEEEEEEDKKGLLVKAEEEQKKENKDEIS